jgi:hypothetical protein
MPLFVVQRRSVITEITALSALFVSDGSDIVHPISQGGLQVLEWPKLLYIYGPFALLVFVAALLESKARKAWQAERSKVSGTILASTWFVIFALCGVVVFAWFWLNKPPFVITGSVQDLRGAEAIGSKDLYSVADYYDKRRDIFNINWAFITTSPRPEGHTLTFRFFRSANEDGIPYQLTVLPEHYGRTILIRAIDDGSDRKLNLPGQLKGATLVLANYSRREEAPHTLGALPTVYAQTQSTLESIFGRLESYDPLIRRDARDELAKQGAATLPSIEKVLVSNKSSYRLRLGILVALNKMQDLKANALSSKAYAAIVSAQKDPDPTLSDEASRFLKRYPKVQKGSVGAASQREATRKQK